MSNFLDGSDRFSAHPNIHHYQVSMYINLLKDYKHLCLFADEYVRTQTPLAQTIPSDPRLPSEQQSKIDTSRINRTTVE